MSGEGMVIMPSSAKERAFPPFHLCMLFFYFIEYFIDVVHWWFFIEYEQSLFGSTVVQAHLAFNIVGCIIFFVVASPFLFMPYHYGKQMEYKIRRNSTVVAIAVSWLFHDMPLFFIEFWIIWNFGWIHVLQGLSMLLIGIAFAVGFFAVWLGYAWKVSKVLQTHFSGNAFTVAVAGGGGPMQGDGSGPPGAPRRI
jgi:hypothetical protein